MAWKPEYFQNGRTEALNLAATLPLPFRTRSLTPLEAQARHQNQARLWGFGVLGFLALWLLMLANDAGLDHDGWMLLKGLGAILLLGLALLWLTRAPQASQVAPPDAPGLPPPISIEIGETQLAVERQAERHALGYEAVNVLWRVSLADGWTNFLGLHLETPIGWLVIDDRGFAGGRQAAAALAGRLERLGRLPEISYETLRK